MIQGFRLVERSQARFAHYVRSGELWVLGGGFQTGIQAWLSNSFGSLLLPTPYFLPLGGAKRRSASLHRRAKPVSVILNKNAGGPLVQNNQQNMQGKICLITGATLGIGKVTALELARQGATVVLVGRNPERTADVVSWIKAETGNQQVEGLLADLSLQTEVRRVATEFKAKYQRLDVLINNAGAVFTKREVTAEGFEQTWALNHLAYFLLTYELLDLLKQSAPARIINVSSMAHMGDSLNFENLQGEKSYRGMKIYGQSKLANVLFTYALARRLAGSGVTVNCLHPGVVATGFGHNTPGALKLFASLAKPLLITPEKGAATTIYLASSAKVRGVSGRYFDKCRAVPSSGVSYDEALQEKLWQLSLEQTGLT